LIGAPSNAPLGQAQSFIRPDMKILLLTNTLAYYNKLRSKHINSL